MIQWGLLYHGSSSVFYIVIYLCTCDDNHQMHPGQKEDQLLSAAALKSPQLRWILETPKTSQSLLALSSWDQPHRRRTVAVGWGTQRPIRSPFCKARRREEKVTCQVSECMFGSTHGKIDVNIVLSQELIIPVSSKLVLPVTICHCDRQMSKELLVGHC